MRIGITGTIGSGKTEACNYLRKKDYDVFDCDLENKKILDNSAFELLHGNFSECFENGVLNKSKLSMLIFNNQDKKKQLEDILHPIILDKLLSRKDDVLFAEVPLLFEANWDCYFDQTLLIVCNEDVALERLKNRGLSNLEAKNRMVCQLSVKEKIKKATRIIYNNGSLDELYKAIDNYLKDIC